MTDSCLHSVHDLENESKRFGDMSVEQLLYAAIKATSHEEVASILTHTNWESEIFPRAKELGLIK